MKAEKVCFSFYLLLALFLLWPLTAESQFFQQGSKLVGTGAVGNASQGMSVAISADGNTAIVGGPYDSTGGGGESKGGCWVFTRTAGVWTQEGSKLIGTDISGSAQQGWSVALSADGNTAIVGGPASDLLSDGGVWVFTRSAGVWSQQGSKLVGTGVAGGTANQGWSVALSADGNTAIAGGPSDSGGIGASWVYVRSGGVWTQQGHKLIDTADGIGGQGWSVALSADGNTAIVGAPGGFGGGATVYTRTAGVWKQQGGTLSAIDASLGSEFGWSVALSADGNTAVVGGAFDSSGVGAAWIFTRSAGVWTQQGNKLVGAGVAGGTATQGYSVALSGDGDMVLIGGPNDNASFGAVWEFTRAGGVWTQLGNKLSGSGAGGSNPFQGNAVALSSDGKTAIVGGSSDSGGVGASWIFAKSDVVTLADTMQDNWNMISVPLTVSDFRRTAVFPTSASNAFSYAGGYVRSDTLQNGSGYWLKFAGAQIVNISGFPLPLVTVDVQPGWNMIGSVSKPIAAASISSHPPAVIASQFFGYDGRYTVVDSIRPGKAYWVKVSESGILILTYGPLPPAESRIRIIPTDEQPPVAPAGAASKNASVPKRYSLEQNFPNPFNPLTEIRYQIAESRFVTLNVYNMLGEEVATLVNEVKWPGFYSATWNANNVPSGMYYYKLQAGPFTDVKKMLLLK